MTEQKTEDAKEETPSSGLEIIPAAAIVAAIFFIGWVVTSAQLPPIWPTNADLSETVRASFDLTAQRWMAISSVAMAVISAGTLFLLWRTLIATAAIAEETRNTTKAATDSASSARDAIAASTHLGRTQAQAYLDIAACRIILDYKSAQVVSSELEIEIRNLGQTPTKVCSLAGTLQFTPASRAPSVATTIHPLSQQVISNREGMKTTAANWKFSEFDFPAVGKIAIVGEVFYQTAFDENYSTPFRFELEFTEVDRNALYLQRQSPNPNVFQMTQIHTLEMIIHQRVDSTP